MTSWVKPRRLDYLPLNERLAVVRLSAELTGDTWPRYPGLLVGAPHGSLRTLALGSVTHTVAHRRAADELLWRVTFAVPLELVRCPQALFGLVASGYSANRLPDPWLASLAALSEPWPAGDQYTGFIGTAVARRAAALGTAVAVAGSGFASPVAALAAGKHPAHTPRAVVLAPRQPSAPARSPVSSAPAPSPSVSPTPAASAAPSPAPAAAHTPSVSVGHGSSHDAYGSRPRSAPRSLRPHQAHRTAARPASSGSTSTHGAAPSHPQAPNPPRAAAQPMAAATPAQHRTSGSHHHRIAHHPAQPGQGAGLSSLSVTPPTGLTGGGAAYHRDHAKTKGHDRHSHHRHAPAGGGHRERRHPSGGASLPKPQPPKPSPAPPPSQPQTSPTTGSSPSSTGSTLWTPGQRTNSAEAKFLSHLSGLFATLKQPPPWLIPIYKKAGAKYHIPWQILAAINSIETDYGRDLNVSPSGAVGWMQFMPSTWQAYGVAVDHRGAPNPYNPADAIFSAARYLAANGGGKHLRQAIFAYNHATWYVDEVVWRAAVINAHAHDRAAPGFAKPFPGGWVPNRLDMGYDGTFGHVLAAPFSGTITFAARSFSNWGGYVEIRADHAIKGLPTRTLYFAEGLSPLFRSGTHVTAGTPIATPAPSPYGDAYATTSRGQGQIEWGLAASGPTGAPTNPLAETGIGHPARMVTAFAIWAVEHLGLAPPASVNHAGYP